MARVTIKQTNKRVISEIAKSPELGDQLEAIAQPVLEAAKRDPNDVYVASLQLRQFVSGGRSGRVSAQVGAAPIIGSRVEAKRGTLARALGEVG